MTTNSNAVPGAVAAPAPRPFHWSVRRELWQNRSLFIAPMAVAGLFLLGSIFSALYYGGRIREIMGPVLALDPGQRAIELAKPYDFAAIMLIVTSLLVAVFYCLDALHGERADRSILFWKSLPVSDVTSVLAKLSIPMAVLPLIAFAVITITQVMMLLISTTAMVTHGVSATPLWTELSWFGGALVLFYGLVVNALWFAPIYGWLLLVSSWAKRSTFLWAILPPLALCVVEAITFRTTYFGSLLKYRIAGGFNEAFADVTQVHGGIPLVGVDQLAPLKFLGSPGLWVGLLVAAGLVAAAIWLRRSREPI